jgi:hypothetical protein
VSTRRYYYLGANVMKTISGDFCQLSSKKMTFFLENSIAVILFMPS